MIPLNARGVQPLIGFLTSLIVQEQFDAHYAWHQTGQRL
jgi:hypothetical protein